MTLFGDYQFFCWLILLLIPAVILGVLEKSRKLYILVSSVGFILLTIASDWRQMLFFAGYILLELHVVKIYGLLRIKYGRNSVIYGHFILLSLAPLVLSKISGFLPVGLFQILGISYVTFKVVQVIIELYDGVIKEVKASEFLAFLLFFPSISSGPIDRSRRFGEDYNRVLTKDEYLDGVGEGLKKLVLGIAYKFVLAAVCYQGVQFFSESTVWYSLVGYAYCYGIYMFFDFAGYSLMAVGVSYFFGIRTPDNFNKPFISRDIKEFWDRWHITLSHWFRDFIFSRFMMQAIRKKWFSKRLYSAAAGFIVNMFIMGVWHGLTPYYLVYGLYHGVLLAGTEIYQKKSKFYKKNKGKTWYQVIAWAITMQFVMGGFLIFSGRLWA